MEATSVRVTRCVPTVREDTSVSALRVSDSTASVSARMSMSVNPTMEGWVFISVFHFL